MKLSTYLCLASVLVLVLFSAQSYGQSNSTCKLNETNSSGCKGINFTQVNLTGGKINMVLAYAEGCPHCAALEAYLGNLNVSKMLNVSYVNAVINQSTFEGYLSYYNVPQSDWGTVPILFLNNTYCIGDTTCEAYIASNLPYLTKYGSPIPKSSNVLSGISILELTGLALVDSINPCAFAVLIFLLSTLFMRDPMNRKKILLGGVAFAMGIFTFYLVVGVLLLLGIKSALAITDLKNLYIYTAFGIFSIILGILNLKDYFAYRGFGFAMEVPMSWRPKMLGTIEKIMLKFVSVPAAFLAGVIVTAFLLPCISGPYLVAGSLLQHLPLTQSVPWLVYYNLLFVLPMFVITIFVYFSFTSIDKASQFREKNVRILHLIAGLLLLFVGALILSSVL